MLIPHFWAEARAHHDDGKREATVRRFGWSNSSQEDAQQHAEIRANAALENVLRGQQLPPRDPRVPYNGAAGLPIREEILGEYGDVVLTRNSYGATCLNTPDVLFIDVDHPDRPEAGWINGVMGVMLGGAVLGAFLLESPALLLPFALIALIVSYPVARRLARAWHHLQGGQDQILLERIKHFVGKHPEWNLVVYQTPGGIRLLATHRTFQPLEPDVDLCFRELGADHVYALMCKNQQCFRARLSPKPWRIGLTDHLRPRPGVWPVKESYREIRKNWIDRYTAASEGYASCRFVTTLGSGIVHLKVSAVQQLHDEMSRARSGLPIA